MQPKKKEKLKGTTLMTEMGQIRTNNLCIRWSVDLFGLTQKFLANSTFKYKLGLKLNLNYSARTFRIYKLDKCFAHVHMKRIMGFCNMYAT